MDEGMYKARYSNSCIPPKFYGLPKIYKTGTPLRPILSSRGSVTYGVAMVPTKVLKPLLGKSPNTYNVPVTCKQGQRGNPPTGRVPHIIWCHCTFHFSSNRPQLLPSLKIYWKRMKRWVTEQYYQYRTSLNFWGSFCIMLTFLFKINSMNRLKEWLWALQ